MGIKKAIAKSAIAFYNLSMTKEKYLDLIHTLVPYDLSVLATDLASTLQRTILNGEDINFNGRNTCESFDAVVCSLSIPEIFELLSKVLVLIEKKGDR
jgi:hypothetical protein